MACVNNHKSLLTTQFTLWTKFQTLTLGSKVYEGDFSSTRLLNKYWPLEPGIILNITLKTCPGVSNLGHMRCRQEMIIYM